MLRPEARCVPLGEVRGVHGKTIAMLGNGDNIFSASLLKQLYPCIRIKLRRGEHWEEVFVSKLRLGAVSLNVMLIGRIALHVHIARVPLIGERWNREDAPMDENA